MPAAVSNLQRKVRVSPGRIRRTAESALSALGRADRAVHVSVVDDPAIRRLNTRYLRIGKTTDVLAFDLHAPGPSRLMGEVIVCADTARRQARRLGVSVALELDLLVVHGLLHLAGWDDHQGSHLARPVPVRLDLDAADDRAGLVDSQKEPPPIQGKRVDAGGVHHAADAGCILRPGYAQRDWRRCHFIQAAEAGKTGESLRFRSRASS